jgi:hypothetical protein
MSVHRIAIAAIAAFVLIAIAPEAEGKSGVLITTCGQTVTTNAVLTQNLVCPGSGIIVGASGITIDLDGFVIRGDRSATHWGIDDVGSFGSVSVRNGVLRNFDRGFVAHADKVTVLDVVASGNVNYGLDLEGNFTKVQSSTVSGSLVGVYVQGNSASIKSVNASENTSVGIFVNGNSASIQSSTVSGNRKEGEIVQDGVEVLGTGGSIKSVSASGNGVGIAVFGDLVTVQSSNASGNVFTGIDIQGSGASLKANRTDANGFSNGDSDLNGLGIFVHDFITPPAGKNTARGNDNQLECVPALVC